MERVEAETSVEAVERSTTKLSLAALKGVIFFVRSCVIALYMKPHNLCGMTPSQQWLYLRFVPLRLQSTELICFHSEYVNIHNMVRSIDICVRYTSQMVIRSLQCDGTFLCAYYRILT
jgi:hypothetical protein